MMDPMQKSSKIKVCLDQSTVNLWKLRELALTEGGLVNADLRREAWCHLVGIKGDQASTTTGSMNTSSVNVPRDELALIRQDVFRSVLFHYDDSKGDEPLLAASGESSSQNHQVAPYQDKLIRVLETVISQPVGTDKDTTERLQYYQGLHDVAGVMLHNLDYDVSLTCRILRKVCMFQLRDAMGKDLKNTTWFLHTVFLEPVLHHVDEELHDFLFLECEVDLTNTVLSWLIAWFTHDIHHEQVASRLMDAFLASHALLPMYLCVAILIHPTSRQEILNGECDPTAVHMTIRGFVDLIDEGWNTGNDAPVDLKTQDLIDSALTLMSMIPPDSILLLASLYDESIDLDRARSMCVMQSPPLSAVASWSSDTRDENKEVSCDESYPHATVACGVSEILNRSRQTEIISKRLSPSNGLVSSNPSVRRLTAKVLCSNLEQERRLRSRCTPTLFCCKTFPDSCHVFGIRLRNYVRVVVFCWNPNVMFVTGVRKRRNRVRVKKLCHSRSSVLKYALAIIKFSAAFMKVALHVAMKTSAFLVAMATSLLLEVATRYFTNLYRSFLLGVVFVLFPNNGDQGKLTKLGKKE